MKGTQRSQWRIVREWEGTVNKLSKEYRVSVCRAGDWGRRRGTYTRRKLPPSNQQEIQQMSSNDNNNNNRGMKMYLDAKEGGSEQKLVRGEREKEELSLFFRSQIITFVLMHLADCFCTKYKWGTVYRSRHTKETVFFPTTAIVSFSAPTRSSTKRSV